ncbi:MAG: ABC transporter permease, partial [Bacteroidales bacterium]|nr:ABC transporter permease [Bacteroidales bacterium]
FMSPGANLAEQENLAINKDTIGTIEQLYMLVNDIPVTTIILSFLFYFLFGYLMYSALFAAVGAAVDNEADTQQFMLPITIPLILGLIMSSFILNNPSGPVAVWLSIIPFTSPIVMMMRIPFGVPIWELVFSMVILVASFLFVTWIAGKIYKTGILMYGKKPSYKEIWKWIKYKG